MKQLLVLSGKGGTGKTTVASGFIKLSQAKAYGDCDVDAPNLHLIMNHLGEPKRSDYYGLPKAEINEKLCIECDLCRSNCHFDAINFMHKYKVDYYSCEGCGVCEILCPTSAISLKPAVAGELMLYKNDAVFSTAELKMGSGTSGKLVTEVKKQLKSASDNTDIAIIDGSPGIGCPVIASLSGVDMVLIVAEPTISGISDMERIIMTAKRFQTTIAICINKYDISLENTERIENYCNQSKIPFLGKIPYDQDAVKAINIGKSVVEIDCIAGKEIKKVYHKAIEILLKEC